MNQTLDEIRDASDAELLRLYRFTLLRNRKGRLDARVMRIIDEIKRRNAHIFENGNERRHV